MASKDKKCNNKDKKPTRTKMSLFSTLLTDAG